MLRITGMQNEGEGGCRMELSGRLVGPWVAELRRVAGEAPSSCSRVVLDLSAVSFVDHDGAALLRELAGRGVGLDGVTPYIAAMLEPN